MLAIITSSHSSDEYQQAFYVAETALLEAQKSLMDQMIGPINVASQNFDFLDMYSPEVYGKNSSVKYTVPAKDYCEDSQLENADLEVIVYDSKIAGINILSWDPEIKNEVYEFTNNFISSLDPDLKNDKVGINDISIGSLLIVYSKYNLRDQIQEILEITNKELRDFTYGEQVLDAQG